MVKSKLSQVLIPRSHPFPLLPEDHANASPHPFIRPLQEVSHVRQLVVIRPAHNILPDGFPPLHIAVDLPAARQFPYPFAHFQLGFLMHPHAKPIFVFVEAISQEFNPACVGHHGLFPVHFEKELLLNVRDDMRQGLLRTRLAFTEDDHIVRIAYKPMASSFQLMVKLAQHDVRTQRTERPTLRHSDLSIFPSSHPYRACPEVFVDKRYNSPIFDASGQHFHHFALVHGVEELLQVHRPHIAFVQVFLTFPNGIMRAAFGAESVPDCFL